ncbi:hypothetical protein A4X13_0g9261, partial [Tilletia indica]
SSSVTSSSLSIWSMAEEDLEQRAGSGASAGNVRGESEAGTPAGSDDNDVAMGHQDDGDHSGGVLAGRGRPFEQEEDSEEEVRGSEEELRNWEKDMRAAEMDVDSDGDDQRGSPSKRPRLGDNRSGQGTSTLKDIQRLFGKDDWGGTTDVQPKNRRSAAGASPKKGGGDSGAGRSGDTGGAGESEDERVWAAAERAADAADREAEVRRQAARAGDQPGASTSAVPTGMMRKLDIAGYSRGDQQAGPSSSQSSTGRLGRAPATPSGRRRNPSASPDAPYRGSSRQTAKTPAAALQMQNLFGPMGGRTVVPPNPTSGTRMDLEDSTSTSGLSDPEDAEPIPPTPPSNKGKGKAVAPPSRSGPDRQPPPPKTSAGNKGKGKATAAVPVAGDVAEEDAPEEEEVGGDILGGNWRHWREACNIVLAMCRPGATDPVAAVATALQMATGPRGHTGDLEPTALMRNSVGDKVLLAMRTLERTYDLSASAGLPMLVDLCAFVLSRRAELVEEYIVKHRAAQTKGFSEEA